MNNKSQQPLLCGTTVCYPTLVSSEFSLRRALEGIARAGLRYVEIAAIPGYCDHLPVQTMGPYEIQELESLLTALKLSPVALNMGHDLTTERGVEFLESLARLANSLGVPTIVTHIQQTETPEGARRFEQLLPRILDVLDRHNVVLALEVHGGHICTGEQGIAYLERLNAPRVKLTYDMANVITYGGILPDQDLKSMRAGIARHIAHVHLKDRANLIRNDRTFPVFGTGVLDIPQALHLLLENGYRGPMALEVELDHRPSSPETVDEAILVSRRYLEPFWNSELALYA